MTDTANCSPAKAGVQNQPAHTQGLITVRHSAMCGHYDLEIGEEAIGQVFYVDNAPGGRGEADADRLADCWNACEGINPEAVPELLHAGRLLMKMLAPWEAMSPNPEMREAIAAMRTAIAKAEASQ